MKRLFTYAAIAVAIALTGCSSVGDLTNSDRKRLSTVAVPEAVVAQGAYAEPDGSHPPGLGENFTKTGAGIVLIAIGDAIDASVAASQQEEFAEQYRNYFEAVKSGMPENLDEMVTEKVREAVRSNAFFSDRITDSSENNFKATIVRYGLVRTYRTADIILLSFRLEMELSLTDAQDNKIFSRYFTAVSSEARTLKDYSQDSALLASAAGKAVASLGKELVPYLETKTTRKTINDYSDP